MKRVPEDEKLLIINYIPEDGWCWQEHPEGPFNVDMILTWKNKAFLWDELMRFRIEIGSLGELVQWIVEKIPLESEEDG